MARLKEHEKADKIYKQACDLLPRKDSTSKGNESPISILEKVEILARTARVLYSRYTNKVLFDKEGIEKCDKLLEDLGRYYGWLKSYYLEKSKSVLINEVTRKKCLMRASKCQANCERLKKNNIVKDNDNVR